MKSSIDLAESRDDWREVLEQLEAEAGQSLPIGASLRALAALEL